MDQVFISLSDMEIKFFPLYLVDILFLSIMIKQAIKILDSSFLCEWANLQIHHNME